MRNDYNRFEMLFIKAQEGIISSEECTEFNILLKSTEFQKIYFEMIKLNCALSQLEISECQLSNPVNGSHKCDISVLMKLASGETLIPEIEITSKIQHPKKRKPSPVIFSISASIAAIITIIFCLQFYMQPQTVSNAVLVECIHASWSGISTSPTIGSNLNSKNGLYNLHEGVVKLRFSSGADVIIESPSRFEILSSNKMHLHDGKVYAKVPKQAKGFTVVTPKCNIIDLGTEFGVKVGSLGITELHVNKGKTVVETQNMKTKQSMEVNAGSACLVEETNIIKDITCRKDVFVREINQDTGMIWRGKTRINLSDIVGGGNGWGDNTFAGAINPVTGIFGAYKTAIREGNGQYARVITTPYPYIDGVFVPVNSTQIISSKGHVFKDCPKTNAQYYSEILNNVGLKMYDTSNKPAIRKIENQNYNKTDFSSIIMHANSGITFNLQNICHDIPGKKITWFTSDALISMYRPVENQNTSYIPRQAKAEVWILIDGKVVFNAKLDEPGTAKHIDIEISDSAQFLSLVATDGSNFEDSDLLNIPTNESDWCIFAKPELMFSVGN